MGADLCMVHLIWDTERKLNWKAGHKAIDRLKKDAQGRIEDDSGLHHSPQTMHSSLDNVQEAVNGNHPDAYSHSNNICTHRNSGSH